MRTDSGSTTTATFWRRSFSHSCYWNCHFYEEDKWAKSPTFQNSLTKEMFSLFVGQFNAQIVLPQASTIASKQGGDERLERHSSKNQIEIHSFFPWPSISFMGLANEEVFHSFSLRHLEIRSKVWIWAMMNNELWIDDAAHIPCHLSQLARENLKNDFSTKNPTLH